MTNGVSTWECVGDTTYYPSAYTAVYGDGDYTPTTAEFVGATKVVGNWLYYEARVEALSDFGGLLLQPDVVGPVVPGEYVGLDVCLVSCGPGTGSALYNGMPARRRT